MKTLLVVAGLDPSGGAGLLADARVAAEHGVRAVGVATALTVQDTTGVRAVNPVAAEIVDEQLRALLGDVEVDAVKLGMLGDPAIAAVVADALAATRAKVVWDPVRLPSRGRSALFAGDLRAAAARLFPEVALVTPNLDEAVALGAAGPIDDVAAMRRAAGELRAAGAAAALVKGGHLGGAGDAVDVLLDERGGLHEYFAPRVAGAPLHGTGCVLSSAIACGLALGAELPAAVREAKEYLGRKLAAPLSPGRGARTLV